MATLRELIIKISANSQSFQSEISRASRMGSDYYRVMEDGGRQVASAQRETQRALSAVTAQINTTRMAVMGLAGQFAGAFATHQLIAFADAWNQMNGRLKLASSSSDDFVTSQRALMDISQRTGTSLEANSNLYSRIAQSLRDAGFASADVANVTETVATSLKLSGASTAEASSVITQLSQALGSGVLRGEEFNAIMENGGRLARLLADGLGTTVGGLRKMANNGELTTDKIVPLLTNVEMLRKEFETLPASVSGSAQKIQNAFLAWVGGANSAVGASAALAGAMDGIAKNINTVAAVAGGLVAVGLARYFGNVVLSAASATAGVINATKSEIALAEAQLRGTQISTARASAAVYRAQQALAAARGTDAQAAAERRLNAAQSILSRNRAGRTTAQGALNRVTSFGSRLAGGALGLIGGLPGLLMAGAAAWYTMYQAQEQARKSAQEYATKIDEIREKTQQMGLLETTDNSDKTRQSLNEQNRLIGEQSEKIRQIKAEIAGYQKMLASPGPTINGYMINYLTSVDNATRGLTDANSALIIEQERLAQMQAKSAEIQTVLEGIEHRRVVLIRQQASEQNAAYQSLVMMNGQHTEFNRLLGLGNNLLTQRQGLANSPIRIPQTDLSDKQQKAVEKSRRDLALSKLKGEAKERLRLSYAADDLGLKDEPRFQTARQELINNGVTEFQNNQANKKKPKGPKTDIEKAGDVFKRLTKQQREQIALEGQSTALAKAKYQITKGELATLTKAQKAEVLRNASLIDQIKLREQLRNYENNLIDSNASAKAANESSLAGYGHGARYRERIQQQFAIRREFEEKSTDLLRQRQAGDIDETFYQQALELNKRYLDQRLRDEAQFYADSDSQRNDWMGAISEGYANWFDEISDISGTVASGVKSSLDGAFSNVTSMLEGNKTRWRSWGVSVLQIIEKVALQMAVVSAMGGSSGSGIFGSVLGGIGNLFGGGSSTGAATGSTFTSGAYNNLSFNAAGGVYSSPSLSAYSGGVYNSPQFFAFAKGAGVFAEAGPEAIMPLARGTDGKLGVRATGIRPELTSSAPQVHITINGGGDNKMQASPGWEQFGAEIGRFVDQRYKQNLQRDISPGGDIWNATNKR